MPTLEEHSEPSAAEHQGGSKSIGDETDQGNTVDTQRNRLDSLSDEDEVAQNEDDVDLDGSSESLFEDLDDDTKNALFNRIRDTLRSQLKTLEQRLTEDVRVKDEEARHARESRESLGVELYGAQQQLAKLQIQLERTHDSFVVIQNLRNEAEEQSQNANKVFASQKDELEMQRGQWIRMQKELDNLNATLRQVERYNEEVKSEIAITRRATYKTEEAMTELEREKQMQDLLIDSLNEQLKRLRDEIGLVDAQLAAQQQETRAAVDTLAEAGAEMEAIKFEKRQLMNQWKSSLIGMQRRNEALAGVEEALHKTREEHKNAMNEATGIAKVTEEVQETNASLTSRLNRLRSEVKRNEKNAEVLQEHREGVSQQYRMLQTAHEKAGEELARESQKRKLAEKEMRALDKQIQTLQESTHRLQDMIVDSLSTQTTLEKSSASSSKAKHKALNEIRAKEREAVQIENELARVRVDSLNTSAQCKILQQTLDAADAALQEHTALVGKRATEIRRRNDVIEKKQREVDALNRRLNAIREQQANRGEENTGPLEATIKSISKSIEQADNSSAETQRLWLTRQTELVELISSVEGNKKAVDALRARHTIMTQRKLRVESQVESNEREVADVRKGIESLHHDMVRMNDLISKNSQLRAALADENFNMERAFVDKLRELERDSMKLEDKIHSCMQEKANLLNSIVEMERQIMMWERKIELENETHRTINPEEGVDVIKSMKKEIHRMELRYVQLQHEQEELMKEMERAIAKREAIALKGSNAKSRENTIGALQAANRDLAKRVATAQKETKRFAEETQALDEEIDRLQQTVDKERTSIDAKKAEFDSVMEIIHRLSSERAIRIERVRLEQKRARLYADGSKKDLNAKRAAIVRDLERQAEKKGKLEAALESMQDQFPDLKAGVARARAVLLPSQ